MIHLGDIAADRTEMLERFSATFGQDNWAHQTSGWTLVGVNPASFDTDPDSPQMAWLGAVLDASTGPVGLFLHKPWFKTVEGDVSRGTRRGIESLFDGHDLRFVAQGHVHQVHGRKADAAGIDWLPSIASIEASEDEGPRLTGLARLSLDPAGHRFHAGDMAVTADCVVDFPGVPAARELADA
jgi:hypothetical protein